MRAGNILGRLSQRLRQAALGLRLRLGEAQEAPENGAQAGGGRGQAIRQALRDEFSEIGELLNQFFNSDWAFGLTLAGARRRRVIITLVGAVWWAYLGYSSSTPGWDLAAGVNFLRSIYLALLTPSLLLIVMTMAGLLWVVLYAANRLLVGARPGMMRVLSLVLGSLAGALWGLLASTQIPTDLPLEFAKNFIVYPFETLFAPGVLRHVLVAGAAFWIAYRMAATYLEDIYEELGDISVAERFILQAAFASQYTAIEIRGGDVIQEHRRSPIFLIGGPGRVQVHYDSASLFESVDGAPRVIGPTVARPAHMETLAGFERLRQALELYDHTEEKFPVEGRTRDGLRIRLKDVNIVYSIYRGGQETSQAHPYPFELEAVLNLVYKQGKNPLEAAMRSVIRREFSTFISGHTMNEFLASYGLEEVQESQEQETGLAEQAGQFSGQPVASTGLLPAPALPFQTRTDMMTSLFAEAFAERAAERGVEIRWLGGGTWEPADTIVLEKHQEAWRLSRQNLVRGNEGALRRLRNESSLFEKLRLVQEAPLRIYHEAREAPPAELMLKLALAYRQILNQAYEALQRSQQNPALESWLEKVLAYLAYFTAHWV